MRTRSAAKANDDTQHCSLDEHYKTHAIEFINNIANTVKVQLDDNQASEHEQTFVCWDTILRGSSLRGQWLDHFMFPIIDYQLECNQIVHNIEKVKREAAYLVRMASSNVRAPVLTPSENVPAGINRILWHPQ